MILMYHHVCPAADVPVDREQWAAEGWSYKIEPGLFAQQLRYLVSLGYRFLSLEAYVAAIQATGRNPKRGVVITFDDGWLDNYTYAFPILRAQGIQAAFFIVSGVMRKVPGARRLAPEQIVDLARHGMTIGSHTRTHCDLTAVSAGEAAVEMETSRVELAALIQRPVRYLAYPGGRFNRTVAELARASGFEAACCSLGGGLNNRDSLFWLHRDILSPGSQACRDRFLLNPLGRHLLRLRARLRMQA
jgi:peptidoglycan/xylan/chitin deacetylase (PgdA/CDA1 family)